MDCYSHRWISTVAMQIELQTHKTNLHIYDTAEVFCWTIQIYINISFSIGRCFLLVSPPTLTGGASDGSKQSCSGRTWILHRKQLKCPTSNRAAGICLVLPWLILYYSSLLDDEDDLVQLDHVSFRRGRPAARQHLFVRFHMRATWHRVGANAYEHTTRVVFHVLIEI
jgi:hypothetical protein